MRKVTITYLLIFVLSGLTVLLALNRFGYPTIGIDDANIFFVYANNLANGFGFVYNIGGEKVEGFTSLLWTIICALVFKLSPYPELTLLLINTALIALGATVAMTCLKSLSFSTGNSHQANSLLWPIIFLVFVFSAPAYVTWTSITLMENGLWSTLLLIASVVVIKDNTSSQRINYWFIPLSIGLLLTRPESFLWVPLFIFSIFFRRMLVNGGVEALKAITPSLIVYVLIVFLLFFLRLKYFGFPLPNTYYAKVSPSPFYNIIGGSKYLFRYFRSDLIVCVSILSVVFTSIHAISTLVKKRCVEDGFMFLPLFAIIGLSVPLLSGGDHFGSFRFYQNIYPILLLCLIYWIDSILPQYILLEWKPGLHRNARIAFVGILVACFVLIQTPNWITFKLKSRLAHDFDLAEDGRKKGEFIRDMFSDLTGLPSLGVIASGGTKYTYPGEVIDLLGLNNTKMAHNRGERYGIKNHAAFEKKTFYELKPTIVCPKKVNENEWEYNENALQNSLAYVVLRYVFDERSFSEMYTYAKIRRKDLQINKALVGWFSRDFLKNSADLNVFDIKTYDYTVERVKN